MQNIGITCPGDADWTNRAFLANHNALTNRFPGADDSWLESRLFNQLAIQAVPPHHPLAPFLRRELDALLPRHPARQQLPPPAAVSPGDESATIEDPPRKVDCAGTVLEFSATTGAWPYNRPCAQQYGGKSQACMVISGRLIVHAPVW